MESKDNERIIPIPCAPLKGKGNIENIIDSALGRQYEYNAIFTPLAKQRISKCDKYWKRAETTGNYEEIHRIYDQIKKECDEAAQKALDLMNTVSRVRSHVEQARELTDDAHETMKEIIDLCEDED